MEEIEGVLTEIIYQNEVNSYVVGIFETEEEQITVVGYLPFISKGDTLKLVGKFVEHKDYGEQFKIETFEKIMPQTLGALETYLANGNVKGVGPATASKIINKFGEDTIHVLKFEPQKLAQIKGITKDKAIQISESFIENWEVWQIVGFLERFGIGAESAKKVYNLLGIKIDNSNLEDSSISNFITLIDSILTYRCIVNSVVSVEDITFIVNSMNILQE